MDSRYIVSTMQNIISTLWHYRTIIIVSASAYAFIRIIIAAVNIAHAIG